MKKCLLCNAEYDNRVEYCFRDGQPLGLPSTNASKQKLVTNHLDSMGKQSMNSMETLDNISIDDLLQIGGTGGFQGFGEFTPIEAPASEDGNTQIMSRADLRTAIEQEMDPSSDDLENILDTFGTDIGAHLEDTLDGVQVGQVLGNSSLDLGSTNEILPGDTLDVLVDDLDVPKLTESELNRYGEQDMFDELDQWEASGPIMQEAARDALAQHRSRSEMQTEEFFTEPDTAVAAEKNKRLPLIGGGVLVLGALALWGLSSGDSSEPQKTRNEMNASIETPAIPMAPVVPVKGSNEADGEPEVEERDKEQEESRSMDDELITSPKDAPTEERKPTADEAPSNASQKQEPVSNQSQQPKPSVQAALPTSTVEKPKASSEQKNPKPEQSKPKTKKLPKKPKTEPKPMPKKDPKPEVDNGWGSAQSGGWGVENCGVTVRSNVSSAKVFIDGVQKGGIGKNITVDCGQHKLEVRADGYKAVVRSIDLMTDATFTMDLER